MWPSGSSSCLCVFTSTTAFAFSRISFPCLLPCPHSVSRSRPPSRHRFFPTKHSAHQQMSGSVTSQSNRTRRQSRTQVFLIRAILIVSWFLSLLLVMVSMEPAAQQAPTLRSSFLPVKWLLPEERAVLHPTEQHGRHAKEAA